MRYLVKVRVNPESLAEFGRKLQAGALDRSLIRSETYCLRADLAVGYSVWEAEERERFDAVFSAWKEFYAEAEIMEIVSPDEAMRMLFKK